MPISCLLRRKGELIDISLPEGGDVVKSALEARCTYMHKTYLRGHAAWDPDNGRMQRVQQTPTRLYNYDGSGRMVVRFGHLYAVLDVLARYGVAPQFESLDDPRPRADCYDFQPLRVLERGLSFRYRQGEALAFMADRERGRIVAPTGFGKTKLIQFAVLAFPRARFDIVTSGVEVADMLVRRLTEVVPDVGQVGGGKERWGHRVTVYVADSLHHAPHDAQEADFVLVDEVHEAGSPSFEKGLSYYKRPRMFGFTATDELRFDGADAVIESLIGPRVFYMSYQEAEANGLVLPVEVQMIDNSDYKIPDSLRDVALEREAIWLNSDRNLKAAFAARRHLERGEQVLVMARSVEHLFHLKRFLPEATLAYDEVEPTDYKRYIAAGLTTEAEEPMMTKARRRRITQAFESGQLRAAISNDIWSRGVDFTQLSVLIRVDGRSSKILDTQIPGRSVRLHEASGKSRALLIDFTDRFCETLFDRSRSRLASYRGHGWTTTEFDHTEAV